MCSDVGWKVDSDDDGEVVGLVVGEVIFSNGINFGKYVKDGVDTRIGDSLGWGIYRIFGSVFLEVLMLKLIF